MDVSTSGGGSGSGITTYPNFAGLPASAPNGTVAATISPPAIYMYSTATMSWLLIATVLVRDNVALSNGQQTVAVTFAVPYADANYIVTQEIRNTVDAQPIFLEIVDTVKTAAGFTATFNAPTDSVNYIFDYAVVSQTAGGIGASPGTVTSVALALPASLFSVSGSPVTNSGTLTGALVTQSANTVFAGPTTGAAATPAMRALVAADIPTIPASSVTGANLTSTTTGVTLGGTPAGALLKAVSVDVQTASTSQPGLISATDWNTFNGKQASGSYITSLTGDVTASGPGAAAATVAKIQGKAVSAVAPTDAQVLIYDNAGAQYVAKSISGDATLAKTGALTLANPLVAKTLSQTIISDYIDVTGGSVPASPSAGTFRTYAYLTQGIARLAAVDPAGNIITLGRDALNLCYNNTGGTLTKGTVVYINGMNAGLATVAKAKADSVSTSPAYGVISADIANSAYGGLQFTGIVSGVDTSAFSSGDILYLSASSAGTLTKVKPLAPNIAQTIATVITSNASTGSFTLSVRDNQNVASGTNLASFQIGTGAGSGAVSLAFANSNVGTISVTPTATRAWKIPDLGGTFALSTAIASGDMAGGAATPITAASYTILATDAIVFVSTGINAISLQLPNPNLNRTIRIKDVGGILSSNKLTLVRFGAENIEGTAANKDFVTNFGAWTIQSDGTNYWMI